MGKKFNKKVLENHTLRLNPRPHPGKQGNQIYLGDREALPSLTLRFAQRAAVQGAPLPPGIIFVEGSPASQTIVGGASISRATARGAGRWDWF